MRRVFMCGLYCRVSLIYSHILSRAWKKNMPWLLWVSLLLLKIYWVPTEHEAHIWHRIYSLYVVDYSIYIDFSKITLKHVFTELQTKITILEISKFLSSKEHLFMNERVMQNLLCKSTFNSITQQVHVISLYNSIKLLRRKPKWEALTGFIRSFSKFSAETSAWRDYRHLHIRAQKLQLQHAIPMRWKKGEHEDHFSKSRVSFLLITITAYFENKCYLLKQTLLHTIILEKFEIFNKYNK